MIEKPKDLDMQELAEFLKDEIPYEHAEYIMGLINFAEADYNAKKLWAKVSEKND
jgi:hypothetical protein